MLSNATKVAGLSLSIIVLLLASSSALAQEQPQPIDQVQPLASDPEQPQPIDQPIATAMQTQPMSRNSQGGSKANILNSIRALLDNQALFGESPANNPVLADLEAVIQKHSVVNLPKVDIINLGPGTVEIEKPDGTIIALSPRFSLRLGIAAGKTNLVAVNSHAKLQIKYVGNGRCRFWDGDDNRFSILQRVPEELEVTLGNGLRNYHFEL